MQILKQHLRSKLLARHIFVAAITFGNICPTIAKNPAATAAVSHCTNKKHQRLFVSSTSTTTTENNANMSEQKPETPAVSTETYIAGSCSVAFVTTPNENSAKKLARGLIENKLAACVNIIPHIQSIYMWEDKVNEDNEYLMMIKTRTSRLEELTRWVRENHPYSVAEVITLPIEQGNAPYLSWIAQTVLDKK